MYDNEWIYTEKYGFLNPSYYDYSKLKHSKNIIDLIEVGDYVNGYYCRYITDINTGEEILCNFDLNEMRWIPLEDIDVWESIVTKEQFSSVEYVF